MLKKPVWALSLLWLLVCTHAPAADFAEFRKQISKSGLPADDLGLVVTENRREVFAMNGSHRFKPASVSKIITGAAILELLGPSFQFRTQMLYNGSMTDDTIRGTVYLRSGGDPSFHTGKLLQLVNVLKKQKIKTIEGDLLVDDSRFLDYGSDHWRTQILSINSQMFPLFVKVDPEPDLNPFSQPQKPSRLHRRVLDLQGQFVVYQNMIEPDLWTAHTLHDLMKKEGIDLKGKVKRGRVPTTARVLGEIVNPSSKIVSQMMKSSNNFFADLLVRNISHAFGERPGTYATGIDFLTFYLDHVKIRRTEYFLNSGSGFSHANAITPRAMVKLLNHLNSQKTVSSAFFSSLPVAGTDGTLSRRMNKTAAQGRVRAKTGFLRSIPTKKLDGVVSLAGFASHAAGRTFTFTFFYNGLASPDAVRSTFDKLCIVLAGGKPVDPPKPKVKKSVKRKAPAKKKTSRRPKPKQ